MRDTTLVADDASVYDTIFPKSLGDLFFAESLVWLFLPLIPALLMLPLVCLPKLWLSRLNRQQLEPEQLFDDFSPRARTSIMFHEVPSPPPCHASPSLPDMMYPNYYLWLYPLPPNHLAEVVRSKPGRRI